MLLFFFTQVWCVLEACYTAPACPLVGGPAVLCLAWRYVTLTTAPRGVAAQMTAITMMCASAVCNCELSPSSYIILIVVIHSPLGRITHANKLAKNGPNTGCYCQFMVPFFTGTIFSSSVFHPGLHWCCLTQPIILKNFNAVSFGVPLKLRLCTLRIFARGQTPDCHQPGKGIRALCDITQRADSQNCVFKPIFQKVEQAKQVQVNFSPFCSVK